MRFGLALSLLLWVACATVGCGVLGNNQDSDPEGKTRSSPGITGEPDQIAIIDDLYQFAPTITGSPRPQVTVFGLPDWMTFEGGVLSGTPDTTLQDQSFTLRIVAENGVAPFATLQFSVIVLATDDLEAPVITSTPPTTVVVGENYAYPVTATGTPTPTITFDDLPDWLTVYGDTIAGTPTLSDVGIQPTISVTATNMVSHVIQAVTINVTAVDDNEVWTIEVVNSDGVTGDEAAMTIDHNDHVHISSLNLDDYKLIYSTNATGAWVNTTVDDSTDIKIERGYVSSIAVDADDTVHIAYLEATYDDFGDPVDINLRYAKKATSDANFVVETLIEDGFAGDFPSLVVDGDGVLHLVYLDYDYNGDGLALLYIANTSGTWSTPEVVDDDDAGESTSLAVDENGKLHVSYYAWFTGTVRYATNASGTWAVHDIDATVAQAQDPSTYTDTSLAVGDDGSVHVAYYHYADEVLMYALSEDGGQTWDTVVVDDIGNTGKYCSLALDEAQTPHIAYYHSDNVLLMHAWIETGDWQSEVVDTALDVGVQNDIALDGAGKLHISYYDFGNEQLVHAVQE